jgi:hypothetical protein
MFFPGTLSWDFRLMGIKTPEAAVTNTFKVPKLITMDPIKFIRSVNASYRPRDSDLNERSIGRLGTLLHEFCHAFLEEYACEKCPGYFPDVENANGHGFAWHRVTLAVEFAAQSTLGLPIELGRQTSLKCNWPIMWWLPSRKEVARWNLKRLRAHEAVRDRLYTTRYGRIVKPTQKLN